MNTVKAIRIGISLLLVLCTALAYSQQREEFNGPFNSWANIKKRFGAKGDGRSDDTRSLQQALDSLSCPPSKFNTGKDAYTVIYLPKGRYRITETLLLRGKIGITIIGEDPEQTVIEWDGNSADTMLWTNGSAYFKISRLTWTGKGQKDIKGIGIHWRDKWATATSRSFASLNIEISDCIFRQLAVGVGGGFRWNDSEVKIARCFFYGCTYAGVAITGSNALDYWIWHCRFINCNIGVSNNRGNYHLYNSYFSGSVVSDVVNDNGYYTSIRGCFSDKSTAFSIDKGSSSNSFKRIFENNTVEQPGSLPIIYRHIGKITLLNNRFDKITPANKSGSANASQTVVSYTSWMPTVFSILSVNNQYYPTQPFAVKGKTIKNYVSGDVYGKQVESKGDVFEKQLPGFLPYVKRPVFEVPAGANAATIQSIIDDAANQKGKRPIVHFPFGEYALDRTLIIPAGSDMQITGDGLRYSTILKGAPKGKFISQTMIRVMGPSFIEIKEIQFGKSGVKGLHAFVFDKVDQQQASVHIDQLYSNCDTTLFINQLNYTRFEKNNSFFADGNIIIGGNLQKAGKGTLQVNCFGGQYSRLEVRNNAKFVSKDCWWEGPTSVPVDLTGFGEVTIDGTKIAPRKADSTPIIRIGNFTGNISLLNMYVQGGIEVGGNNPALKFFLWNANFYYKKAVMETIPSNFRGQLGYAGITTQCFYKNDPYCDKTKSFPDRFVNVKNEPAFVEEMTRQDRNAIPAGYNTLPAGITNIYMTRVTLDTFRKGLSFTN